MTRTRFDVGGFLAIWQTGKQIKRGEALAGRRDVIIFAFDNFDGDAGDFAEINGAATDGKYVLRDLAVLENTLDGREVEFRRHIHHGEVFIIKAVVFVMFGRFAFGSGHDLFFKGGRVGFRVHRNK